MRPECFEGIREEGLSAEDSADFSQVLSWLADAFWDAPTPQLVAAFPVEGLRALSLRLRSADRVQAAMEELRRAGDDELKEARVEYTALFCSTDEAAPFPYESVYRTHERLLMRPSRDDVVARYEAVGFSPLQGSGHEPEDNLSIQLRFLAALVASESDEALGREGVLDIGPDEARRTRRGFAVEHMRCWVGRFADEVEVRARLPLYPALAALVVEVTDLMAQ